MLVQGGALPVPVEVVQQSTVGPTLGRDAIDASIAAGVIGLALTGAFLVLSYRLLGVLAAVALATYGLISYAVLVTLGATLTLPGLAGLLLSAGLAIDANVLVFERAREEYARLTRGIARALRQGYGGALSAVTDSAATTVLAAGLLFLLASGPVRGFGVTLLIGTLASLVCALLVTRALTDVFGDRPAVDRPAWLSGLASLGRVRTWLLSQATPPRCGTGGAGSPCPASRSCSPAAASRPAGCNLGVEFTGGRLVELLDDGRRRRGAPGRRSRRPASRPRWCSGSATTTCRCAPPAPPRRSRSASARRWQPSAAAPSASATRPSGRPSAHELRDKALIALGVALLAQLVYLAVRFRWTFAAGAVLAMLHDVVIVVGVFAWLGKSIDGVFLAAALTIVGVSVNDSIVTLDRVREIWAPRPLAAAGRRRRRRGAADRPAHRQHRPRRRLRARRPHRARRQQPHRLRPRRCCSGCSSAPGARRSPPRPWCCCSSGGAAHRRPPRRAAPVRPPGLGQCAGPAPWSRGGVTWTST